MEKAMFTKGESAIQSSKRIKSGGEQVLEHEFGGY
jgi:hypothetical protein